LSKFRKQTKQISVNGKLPANAVIPTLQQLRDIVPSYSNMELKNGLTQILQCGEICIVKSKKENISVKGDVGLLPVKILLDAVRTVVSDSAGNVSPSKSIHLKVLDIVAFVLESPASVIKVKNCGNSLLETYRYSSTTRIQRFGGRINFPFLSKRFEKTSFFGRANTHYLDCFTEDNLGDWAMDLDWYKFHTPQRVLDSETVILMNELGGTV
jgi:hypothetical protein